MGLEIVGVYFYELWEGGVKLNFLLFLGHLDLSLKLLALSAFF